MTLTGLSLVSVGDGIREPVTSIFSIFWVWAVSSLAGSTAVDCCACAIGAAKLTTMPALSAFMTANDSFFRCILFISKSPQRKIMRPRKQNKNDSRCRKQVAPYPVAESGGNENTPPLQCRHFGCCKFATRPAVHCTTFLCPLRPKPGTKVPVLRRGAAQQFVDEAAGFGRHERSAGRTRRGADPRGPYARAPRPRSASAAMNGRLTASPCTRQIATEK